MRKRLLLFAIVFAGCCRLSFAQKNNVDSLTKAYQKNRQDTTLVQLLINKAGYVFFASNIDSAMSCLKRSLAISRKIHFRAGEVRSQAGIANVLTREGDLPRALKITFDLLPEAMAINDQRVVAQCYNSLGLVYGILKDYKKSLNYMAMAKNVVEKARLADLKVTSYNNVARIYLDQGNADSAVYYTQKAYEFGFKTKDRSIGYPIRNFGIIQVLKKNYPQAINFFWKSIQAIPKTGNHYLLSEDYRRMADAYRQLNRADSCIYFAKNAFEEAKLDRNPDQAMKSAMLLSDQYRLLNDYRQAYDYQQIMLKANDSLFSQQKTLQIQTLAFNQEQQKQEAEAARRAYQNRVQLYTLLGVIGVFMAIAAILLYANSQRKKANKALEQRNEQIETQHKALEKTLAELKTTQTQLIQSEKMASLGELTAGIAHEIQNPLNFVNNFSEVTIELSGELKEELKAGNTAEAEAIANDIEQNLKKINNHGKRADFIVKGMLQHSRTSTGERQITNINVLADEFLKLSYYGLRAKDNSFNAELITSFDENLPKVNIVQQDIGRVLLNLFNNALYAVNQKQKTAGGDYKPEVSVTSSTENRQVIIKVRDNGMGIPDAIKEKIMQPFFTTKPTGEGTGLGLSLSYDIVVKGHGGKIEVSSKEGDYSEFTITLPIN